MPEENGQPDVTGLSQVKPTPEPATIDPKVVEAAEQYEAISKQLGEHGIKLDSALPALVVGQAQQLQKVNTMLSDGTMDKYIEARATELNSQRAQQDPMPGLGDDSDDDDPNVQLTQRIDALEQQLTAKDKAESEVRQNQERAGVWNEDFKQAQTLDPRLALPAVDKLTRALTGAHFVERGRDKELAKPGFVKNVSPKILEIIVAAAKELGAYEAEKPAGDDEGSAGSGVSVEKFDFANATDEEFSKLLRAQ